MLKIKEFSQRNTMMFTVLVVLSFVLIYHGAGMIWNLFPESLPILFLEEVFDIVWPVGMAVFLGYGFSLSIKGFWRTLKAGTGVLIFYLLMVVMAYVITAVNPATQWRPFAEILLGIITLTGIGIREEVIFRGIIGNSLMLKFADTVRGMWMAIIISGFVFGAVHWTNIVSGVSVASIFIQSLGAAGIGILLTAIYLRGGNIWVLVIIHTLIDTSGMFDSSFTVTTVTHIDEIGSLNPSNAVIIFTVCTLISLYLLRKSKQAAVLERLEGIRKDFII